jgi:SAM-dependent methyltransferase
MTGERQIKEHNEKQLAYFGAGVKDTMRPADTPYVRRQVDEMLRTAGIEKHHRIIEVGCGMGRYTLPLLRRGYHNLAGLDLSPFLLDQLRGYLEGEADIPLYCADLIDHPAELDGQFDFVAGFFMLHHLHDLELCFAAMRRMLKPGGRLVFLEPNAYNVSYYLQILLSPRMTWEGDKGVARMRPGVVFPAMRRAGLVNPAVHRFGFLPPALANRARVRPLEGLLEAIPPLRPVRAFQLFQAQAP